MKTPKPLSELLDRNQSTNSLYRYRQKSDVFVKIKRILSDILGDNIAQNVTVSNYKNSIVYFESHSAVVATGFKMQQSQILSALRSKLDPALVTVEMKVSPKTTQTATRVKQVEKEQNKSKPKKHIPEQALSILQSIADNADDTLKQKISRLMQHKKDST
ncbi:MAG: DUF721 domain-containing protein [Gammaproteobacteria bacterium]|nr:DUF721 domain-containing protein [Gammaproteobacteria bacterium]